MEEIILDFDGCVNWLKKMTRSDKKRLLYSVDYACRGICEFIFNSEELPAITVSYSLYRFEVIVTANLAVSRFYEEFSDLSSADEFIWRLHDILKDESLR